jgi:NAD(P)-dependent dehydrogenase (short-subunit alcohol dehydrogenase family)
MLLNMKGSGMEKKNVVITGGSRGIGYALAEEFIRLGCRVMISGRQAANLDLAVRTLGDSGGEAQTCVADAASAADTEALWQAAVKKMGSVDIWINNAGLGQNPVPVWEVAAADVHAIVGANLTGLIYGCQAAFRGMRTQGYGSIFNMEGFGSDGRHRNGLTVYGASKRAVRYLSEGLAQEAQGSGVLVGSISPGMVATDFLMVPLRRDPEQLKRNLRLLNILADRPETVARYLAPRMLLCRKQNAKINWLSGRKLVWRFLTAAFVRRKIISE